MGWLAWSADADRSAAHASLTPQSQLEHGALVIEGPLPSEVRAVTLLEVASLHPSASVLRVQSIPGEGFSVLVSQGSNFFHAIINHTLRARTDHFRLTLNWDAATGQGLLSIEHPGDDAVFAKPLTDCIPMPGALLLGALSEMRAGTYRKHLDYVAVHNGRWAIGPSATLDYNTPVLTPQGYKKIGLFRPGDTVVNASGDIVPVLAVFRKTVPALGSHAPVRLRAPYFGLSCDLVMAGTQRMIVGGSDVEYTFGRDNVLIPAQHLINGTAAIRQPVDDLVTYYQLLLPGHDAIVASNMEVESLFVGRLRRRKDCYDYTTLAGVPRRQMPEHAKNAAQILRPFEAITLAAMRAA